MLYRKCQSVESGKNEQDEIASELRCYTRLWENGTGPYFERMIIGFFQSVKEEDVDYMADEKIMVVKGYI
jgi:hypothetical protein